ncbi:FecR domain-containing protein [Herbaspirillum sp. alder98]|uniref:FecR domain-containing protein n=1 Tax=Herbaspirillum sp. alder98 TaxID=2913096 RepID=UPI001CD8E327|nr:FecR domain-containing protein [Herbaspirillum sp. alder98]MCA1324912.1 FecR domain-containing protein [Herbaspirillum sp. alder98]
MMRPDLAPPIDKTVALQAAEYFFVLRAPEATKADIEACARWRAAAPEHERAWQHAQDISRKFGMVPGHLANATLGRHQGQARRQAVKTLALLLVAAPAGWMTWHSQPARAWRADYRTATGERMEVVLDDGSKVTLNTQSAIDVAFDGTQRLVRLIDGEILIETAADKGAASSGRYRPFLVETAEGQLRALGTRFIVRQNDDFSRLAVLEGRVEINRFGARKGDLPDSAPTVVAAGEQTRFSAHDIVEKRPLDPHADSWLQGELYASDMRLDDFLAELQRYRRGILRCDPAVASLRIAGVFQLKDTEQVLHSLPNALPVNVRYRTRYWVTLVPSG